MSNVCPWLLTSKRIVAEEALTNLPWTISPVLSSRTSADAEPTRAKLKIRATAANTEAGRDFVRPLNFMSRCANDFMVFPLRTRNECSAHDTASECPADATGPLLHFDAEVRAWVADRVWTGKRRRASFRRACL